MEYTLKYDDLIVTYEMEGDVDGAFSVIKSIKNSIGEDWEVDAETETDMKFLAKMEYSDLQYETYMKTGQMI